MSRVEGVTAKVWALVMRIRKQMGSCQEANADVLESLQATCKRDAGLQRGREGRRMTPNYKIDQPLPAKGVRRKVSLEGLGD